VWVLDTALVAVSRVVAVAVVAVVDCDVAAELGASGCGKRSWGVCWSAVGWAGSE
jgi:hypothetical protein